MIMGIALRVMKFTIAPAFEILTVLFLGGYLGCGFTDISWNHRKQGV